MENLIFRHAIRADVPQIVKLLADDVLGAKRERYEMPVPSSYLSAFDAIESDPNNELIVACDSEEIVGTLQLTFTPCMTFQGGWRVTIEAVRVDSRFRSQGIGTTLFEWAIQRAKERNCDLIQLTTDKVRPDAKRFYEQLGFTASHEGMKLHLK